MSKLEHLAERAPQIIADLEQRADGIDQRLTKLEKSGDETLGKWEGHLTLQEKAISTAQAAINQLSNVPLADSTTDGKQVEGESTFRATDGKQTG
jgi:hypothetical protein